MSFHGAKVSNYILNEFFWVAWRVLALDGIPLLHKSEKTLHFCFKTNLFVNPWWIFSFTRECFLLLYEISFIILSFFLVGLYFPFHYKRIIKHFPISHHRFYLHFQLIFYDTSKQKNHNKNRHYRRSKKLCDVFVCSRGFSRKLYWCFASVMSPLLPSLLKYSAVCDYKFLFFFTIAREFFNSFLIQILLSKFQS